MVELKINLPEGFYEPEERYGYQVTPQVKRLWAIELDLLAELDRICKKHSITYYAFAGTLLGAVRHKGFIPWDDDIDVMVPWEDYKRLLQVAPQEVKNPYFFQCHLTDVFAEASHARLRNSNTTGCTQWELNNIKSETYNRGIFIDIFPMFPVPKSDEAKTIQKEKIGNYWRAIRGWNAVQCHQVGCKSSYNEYIPYWEECSKSLTIKEIKQQYLESCAVGADETDEFGATSFKTHLPRFIYRKEWFEESILMPFENTEIICPKKYLEVLAKTYGDWETPVYNGALHEMCIIDVDNSFNNSTEAKAFISQ